MNNPSCNYSNSSSNQKCPRLMRFGERQIYGGTVFLALAIITAIILYLLTALGSSYQNTHRTRSPAVQNLNAPTPDNTKHIDTDKLIAKLKRYGLWKIDPSQEIPRFFIKNYPADLSVVNDISLRKRVFLHSLLPHALFVREEALGKRQRLESILGKIDCAVEDINFANGPDYENQCAWSDFLTEDEGDFIQNLSGVYRTSSAAELLERVDAVPTSIILAQGALESSWGSSRFTREGNSIFGMWTWNNKGIIPMRRDEGKTHKVKIYESVLDSVRNYHLTLNRLDTYEQFRQARKQTNDPLILAEGLLPYSERGGEYVEEIKNVIQANNLQKYDTLNLSDLNLQKLPGSVPRTDIQVEPGKAPY